MIYMKTLLKLAVYGICILITQVTHAAPIIGTIGFSGSAVMDSTSANTATMVTSWNTTVVDSRSQDGVFTNITDFTLVSFSPVSWPFNSGPITNFCSVGNFTFNITSSAVFSQSGGFFDEVFSGTVSASGFDRTPFNGSFQFSNPSANGVRTFTDRFSISVRPARPPNLIIATNFFAGWSLVWPATNNYTYTLQQNSDLTTTNWADSPLSFTTSSGTNYCPIPATSGNLFFRLRQ